MPHICHFEKRLQMIGIWGQTKQPQGKTEPSKLCLVSHKFLTYTVHVFDFRLMFNNNHDCKAPGS